MNEQTLKSLIQLFAIIANLKSQAIDVIEKSYIESFLKQQFSQKIVKEYQALFITYFTKYQSQLLETKNNSQLIFNDFLSSIAAHINKELPVKQKYIVLIHLFQFIKYSEASVSVKMNEAIHETIENIADKLLIDNTEYKNCKWFIFRAIHKIPEKNNLLIIGDNTVPFISGVKQINRQGFRGQLFLLQIKAANIYISWYKGDDTIEINNKIIFSQHIYILNPASIIRSRNFAPIYFNEIVSSFFDVSEFQKVNMSVINLEFKFHNTENGIRPFSFFGESGQMIGIMGGSGVGKSTLLNLLSGKLTPHKGNVYINGYDVHKNKKELEGLIGFIPQDDLLIEELSVFHNLYFNARLCFGNLSEKKILEWVNNMLIDLGLFEIKHLKVGTPVNKFISGGQRKRLNIALELIREPFVLFVDEPTSGLSSTDSLNVMTLLKEQALKGKFLMINIHQPSSEIFKMFDKLVVLDQGGYPVYFGNPVESIIYLKDITNKVDVFGGECPTCGNINPEKVLEIIEERDVNEYGEYSEKRKISPSEWYQKFKQFIHVSVDKVPRIALPTNNFKIPNVLQQFIIFSKRNTLTKIKDKQYIIMAAIIPPLLAIILSFITKFVFGTDNNPFEYLFIKNENMPGYLFMTVVVAIFLGLIISAEDIIHDRRILEREKFLNLSCWSYLNSKIIFLIGLSAIQMMVIVLIGNTILEIKEMTLRFWLVLFSTACFANMLGLVISSSLKSVIAIYILVPFLIVPQLLLSGTIVKFDKLHYTFSSQEYVPLAGNLMASRWAYEALLINQYKNNSYYKHYFYADQEEKRAGFNLRNLIPELENKIEDCNRSVVQMAQSDNPKYLQNTKKTIENDFLLLKHELYKLNFNRPLKGFDNFNIEMFNQKTYKDISIFLANQKYYWQKQIDKAEKEKEAITNCLVKNLGSPDEVVELKQKHFNESIADLVQNNNEFRIMYITKNKIIQKSYPVYKVPESKFGRAHFYSSYKKIGVKLIQTELFNIIMIWLMTFICYILLIFNTFGKILLYFEKFNFRTILKNNINLIFIRMKNKILIKMKTGLLFSTLLLLFSCGGNRQSKPKLGASEFDSIMDNQKIGFEVVQEVIYRFPTPGEMFGVIKEGGLTYNINLLNKKSNVNKYLGLNAQALNLGVYTADFAYIALFGRQNEATDYIDIIENLSKTMNVSEAISEELVKKIKANLGNIDSLILFSDEAFVNMFSFCENNDMHQTNSLISAGAYIEGIYIALQSIDKFEENHLVLDQLAEQKYSFENLLMYASNYRNDPNVNYIVEELKKISAIYNSLESEQRISKISPSSVKMVIGGGKKYKFNEKNFKELKSLTYKLRNSIINLS